MLRRTMVLVKPLPIQTVPSWPSWAPLSHTGENSSASGVSVLGESVCTVHSVFIQCSVWTESTREVDAAEY